MKARDTIPLAALVLLFLILLSGCSSQTSHTQTDHPPGGAPSDEPDDEASLAYLIENAPTRDQMLRVRGCATARTGYEFSELPADFGSQYAFQTRSVDAQQIPDHVYSTSVDCIFELGLEDRFFPPWDHDKLRERNVED